MEQRLTFRHVHAITGTFVLVALGVLIAALALAGRSQRWFIGNATLRIVLPEAGASGIRQGSEVYFLGTRVGTVSDVIVDTAGHMTAETTIRRDFFRFVRHDSSALVKKKFGLTGDAFFEITRGEGRPLPERNATIACNEHFQSPLESAIDEIRLEALAVFNQAKIGLERWTTLGTNLLTTSERLDQLVARVDTIAADLQEGKGTAGKLLTDPSVADEMKTLLVHANHSLDDLKGTLLNLEHASGNVQAASTNLPAISHALDEAAQHLPGLAEQSETSMREVQRVVEAMQRHWLLRKYVNKTDPPPARSIPVGQVLPQTQSVKVQRSPKDSANLP